MLFPSLEDFLPLVVHGEVVRDDIVGLEMADVNLFIQNGFDNSLNLATVERLKFLDTIADEWKLDVIVCQLALNLEAFAHHVNYTVIKEEYKALLLKRIGWLVQVFLRFYLVVDLVEDSTPFKERSQLHE